MAEGEYDEFVDENRETRMPAVDGVPITEFVEPFVEQLSEREQSAPSPVARASRSESRCTYDPRPGQKCPVCGRAHLRTGRSVKIHVPASGDAKTDFKKGRK